jgi:nucleotide-binding universal stress UspA family protein
VLEPDVQETAALDKALTLVRQNGARLTLFSVLKKPPGIHGYVGSIAQHQQASAIAERGEWLRGLMAPLRHDDIDVVFNVAEGSSFLEIIRQVLREQHDLVITTAEEIQGMRARVFGATSMHLMRKCPCPVWVVKRAQTRPHARILAAVDPSVYDPKRDSLNPLILQLAGSMARNDAAELHIVHVWSLFGERYLHNSGMTEKEFQEAKEYEKEQHKLHFDTLLNRVDVTDLKPHVYLVEGDPVEFIPKLVKELDIDLLVMGSVGRAGIAGFLIGNTAEEVFNQVDCSLLTLKPKGFVTPVTLE